MAKTVRAKLAWLSAGVGSGTISRPSFTLRVSGANENGKIRACSDFFAGRFDTVSPRAPRSGPAPKVHWSM